MELIFSNFSILLTFLLFILMVLKIGKTFKNTNEASNLPPGPPKLPLIGNLHQLVGSLPTRRLRDLAKKYGPFMHLQLGEISAIIVSSPKFAEEVMKTHDVNFASRPYNRAASILSYGYTDLVFSPYGNYWRQLRKICTLELLSTKRVQSFRSVREEEIAKLIDWIASKSGSVINLSNKICELTYAVTSSAAFGKVREADQELFISAVKDIAKALGGFTITNLFPSVKLLGSISGTNRYLQKLHEESDRVVGSIINERKKCEKSEGDKHLVDVLLKLQEQNDLQFPLTNENIKAVIFDMFGAGIETSSTVLEWTISELIKNPRVMEKAQAEVREVYNRMEKVDETGIVEMKFLKLVIKETMRLHPALPFLVPRVCREKCEINGFNVPADTKVMVNAWAIGRDPEYWNEPESFDPDRFIDSSIDYKGINFEYLPFGSGRRMCPGASFGLANVELPLALLLYHFDWKLSDGMKKEDLDMTESFGATLRRKNDLRLIPIPYHP
ncbi:premnaspirodiene oxygenase-like [Pistacia vera]|uniref:premnaspirodiene oxygenase-like n=1 Tax=Pistacia vera TaxID=55513 RepID=UPI0012634180|nr:premnaspirodiene oxygenase-like [Pistacia vera]